MTRQIETELSKLRRENAILREPLPEIHSSWDNEWVRKHMLTIVPAGNRVILPDVDGWLENALVEAMEERRKIFLANSKFKRVPAEPFMIEHTTPDKDIEIILTEDCRVIDALAQLEKAATEYVQSEGAEEIRHYFIEHVRFDDGSVEFGWGT